MGETTRGFQNVRRMALPRFLPVFRRVDLADRWSVEQSTIKKWADRGKLAPEDVPDAEGNALGWSWTTVARMEANDSDLRERFERNRVDPLVRVEWDGT